DVIHRVNPYGGAQRLFPFIWLLLAPILFYACQFPLWIFRSLFRWRIAKVQQGEPGKVPRLSIAGILAATAVIALSLGAVRLGYHLILQMGGTAESEKAWWTLTGIWAAVITVISLTVLPLFTVAIFRTRSLLLGV